MKKLNPLAGYCLILPLDEQDQKTSSGLVLPEKAKEKPIKGRVIEVGDPIPHCYFLIHILVWIDYEFSCISSRFNIKFIFHFIPFLLAKNIVYLSTLYSFLCTSSKVITKNIFLIGNHSVSKPASFKITGI